MWGEYGPDPASVRIRLTDVNLAPRQREILELYLLLEGPPRPPIQIEVRERRALTILDGWSALLPVRVATEDVGDYIEDIHRRAEQGQHWLLWVRVITAVVWTGINAAGFVTRNILGRSAEGPSDKKTSP